MEAPSACVLGGTGFVGTALCAALAGDGWRLAVPTRNPARAARLSPLPTCRLVPADVHDPATLERLFERQALVVNLVGILNERGRDGSGFERAHAELARKVVAACARQRVPRLLHMSALGADAERGPSHYLRSKGRAEQAVRAAPAAVAWTIFRPSVIFGPGDDFLNRFARLLRFIPFGLPLARPRARFAPVWVGDVVLAFRQALADRASAGECYELCGPETFTLRELVALVRGRLGVRRAIVGLPDFVSRMQAAVCDFVPGKPFSTDNYRSLTVDSLCGTNGLARLGIRPQPIAAILPRIVDPAVG